MELFTAGIAVFVLLGSAFVAKESFADIKRSKMERVEKERNTRYWEQYRTEHPSTPGHPPT